MSQPTSQWLVYAIASGGCAALNGVFAKLVTTTLTTKWATSISNLFGVDDSSTIIEYAVRIFFFLLNLAFNGIMWALFTRALTLGSSTVRVSVINTSANFMLTALLGAVIFQEDLPTLWWLGAAMLVTGSVIIGRRDEGKAETIATEKAVDSPVEAEQGSAEVGKTSGVDGGIARTTDLRRKPPPNGRKR